MTTFQAIVYAILHGLTEFLPVSSSAHQNLVPYFFDWPAPTGAFSGALSLGALMSLLVYFRHDWASIISSLLQVIIYRKKPMTLDERLPFFMALSSIPTLAVGYYFQESLLEISRHPLWIAAGLAFFGLCLGFFDSMSRKTKGMFDWNVMDALILGTTQALMFLPGAGRMTGAVMGGMMRNYQRESAAKYSLFIAAPLLVANLIHELKDVSFSAPAPAHDLSWLSFGVAALITLLVGLIAIGSLMKQIQRNGFRGYITYRWLLAIAVVVVYWTRYEG